MPNPLYTTYKLHPQDTGYVIQQDHYDGGQITKTMVPALPAANPPAPVANYAAIVTKAQNALASNQTFLALASPTNAQAIAQTQALTRQTDAIIYFLLHELTGLNTIPGT